MRKSTSPVWHPFTQHAVQPDPPLIARGEGAWLETAEGERIFDAISSWWVVTHGHRHPHIMQAIKDQADRLDQVIFAGFTHEPAEKLARRLVAMTPPELEYVFFSDSGSTSVEVALKMALGFWRHRGEKRTGILALEGAYHGDTVGGMSVGERGVFNAPYDPLLFDVERLPFPALGREEATLHALNVACRKGGVAALIVEPLILGAGGMLIYAPEMLSEMKRICETHGVLFIADEVMTGWGRTGTLFACEQARVTPDIACYSKGLDWGLAATRGHIVSGRHFRRALFDRSQLDLLSFQLLYRKPDRLRGGAGQPGDLGERTGAGASCGDHPPALERVRSLPRGSAIYQCPSDRFDCRIGPRIERDRLFGCDRTASLSGFPVTTFAGPAARQHDLYHAALLQRGKRTRPGR